jgi:hypothetical protein
VSVISAGSPAQDHPPGGCAASARRAHRGEACKSPSTEATAALLYPRAQRVTRFRVVVGPGRASPQFSQRMSHLAIAEACRSGTRHERGGLQHIGPAHTAVSRSRGQLLLSDVDGVAHPWGYERSGQRKPGRLLWPAPRCRGGVSGSSLGADCRGPVRCGDPFVHRGHWRERLPCRGAPSGIPESFCVVDRGSRSRVPWCSRLVPAGGNGARAGDRLRPRGPTPAGVRPTPRGWPLYQGYGSVAAARGAVGVTADHRLHDPGDYPLAAADVAAASALTRADPRVDADRVAVWFFSRSGLLLTDWLRAAPPWLRCAAASYPILAPCRGGMSTRGSGRPRWLPTPGRYPSC